MTDKLIKDERENIIDKLKIENLSGKHKEGAFVEIRVNEKC